LKCDFLIVGAGIIGLSIAYHLKESCPSKDVVVVEAKGGPGFGDTGKSAAAFRSFLYSKTNLALASTSIEFYRHVQDDLKYDLGMKFVGYLFLFTKSKYNEIKDALDAMSKRGLSYKVIDRDELRRRLNVNVDVSSDEEAQLMGLEDIDVGIFVEKAGVMKPENLTKFYEEQFLKLNGKILYNTKVTKIILEPKNPIGIPGEPFPWQEVRIAGVETTSGTIKAEKTIIAAGAQTPQLLDPIGIDVHIKPKKRQVFVLKASTPELQNLLRVKGFNRDNILPFTILPKGVYLRPAIEENAFWTGMSDDIGRAFSWEEDPQPERNFYLYGIYQVLSKYFPQFLNVEPSSAWAGYYDLSIDCQPVVFEVADLIVAAGTSGSGIMKADAVGRIVKALCLGEEYAELYGGEKFRVKDLSLEDRRVEKERIVI